MRTKRLTYLPGVFLDLRLARCAMRTGKVWAGWGFLSSPLCFSATATADLGTRSCDRLGSKRGVIMRSRAARTTQALTPQTHHQRHGTHPQNDLILQIFPPAFSCGGAFSALHSLHGERALEKAGDMCEKTK